MTSADSINFLEALVQRLQHGALLADQTNDIAIRLIPHIEALKSGNRDDANIIDVTPTQRSQSQVVQPYRPPAPPQDWNTPSQPQNAEQRDRWNQEARNVPQNPNNPEQRNAPPEAPGTFTWGNSGGFPPHEGQR